MASCNRVGTVFDSAGMMFQHFPKGNIFRQGLCQQLHNPLAPPFSLAHITVTSLLLHLSEDVTPKWEAPRVQAGPWPSKGGVNRSVVRTDLRGVKPEAERPFSGRLLK